MLSRAAGKVGYPTSFAVFASKAVSVDTVTQETLQFGGPGGGKSPYPSLTHKCLGWNLSPEPG